MLCQTDGHRAIAYCHQKNLLADECIEIKSSLHLEQLHPGARGFWYVRAEVALCLVIS